MVYFLDDTYSKIDEFGHHLYEMAQVGRFGNFKICVYGGERDISHFHFINTSTQKEGCLQILKNEYYIHGGHNLVLNAKERKRLVDFLASTNKDEPKETNFQALCVEWNRNNPNFILPKKPTSILMPDYLNMPLISNKRSSVRELYTPKGFI